MRRSTPPREGAVKRDRLGIDIMDVVRTPDQRFARLSAYPYAAASLALDSAGADLHLAYVSEGAHDGRPVLLLHGPPTWSFLWRGAIPTLVEGGCRVVAPDLIGFGRSDKPTRPSDHRLDRHAGWLMSLVEALDLRRAALVAHGAAAPLALRLLAAGASDRFAHFIAVSPRFAPAGPFDDASLDSSLGDQPPDEAPAAEQVARGCAGPLGEAARAGYEAPFAEPDHAAGLRAPARFLPGWPNELAAIDLPILAIGGERDQLADSTWIDRLPGPADRRRRIAIAGAGHYVPEERGPELALALLAFLAEPSVDSDRGRGESSRP